MSEQVGPTLSAALRAQASGLGTGSPVPPTSAPAVASPGNGRTQADPRLPAWVILTLAVVLGAMAGALASVISTW
ncbi:MAG: hypothetical protein ACRDS0_18520 [Pseudonocardiaceae bacterium]